MNLETRKDGNVMYLMILDKNLDATLSTNFKGRVVDLINQGNKNFILNLKNVQFIDSSGLGSLVSILKTLTLNNGNFILCEANLPVLNSLSITRLDRVLPIHANEVEAFNHLKNNKLSNV